MPSGTALPVPTGTSGSSQTFTGSAKLTPSKGGLDAAESDCTNTPEAAPSLDVAGGKRVIDIRAESIPTGDTLIIRTAGGDSTFASITAS